ncbi:GNAT family N-acetyltransferase [Isobaculum melis]|uniref:Protein N-acetyltransferase, RimJ/RimL family n=1 Tax=Isobaculum melis TaxID=142588 RepID=A0A1H9QDE5_9LACT|nr:GNAT family N-acetyltransferase [Isobaculum melis]SER58566.1 Protein N-acetyltransferase, RimJ/RimL family [Isobaculum melis]
MKLLETERLFLRPWQKTDVADLYDYAKLPNVGPQAGWAPHQNLAESQKILEMFIAEDDTWAVVLKEENKVIGAVGLHDRKPKEELAHLPQREIGYVLHPDYWGNGYMPEAVKKVIDFSFNELKLALLWCGHYDFNEKSRRVVQKVGFQFEFEKETILTRLDHSKVIELFYSLSASDNEINE